MENYLMTLLFLAELKTALVLVALICNQLAKNCQVSASWTSDYEFCEIRWFEFISERQEWNKTCVTNASNISTCCIAEKDYLLQRFKRYNHLCPLEGKCGCTKVEVNSTVRYPSELSNISWAEPTNFTCSHKYILDSVKKPNRTSPRNFLQGRHTIPYIYNLYGGKKVTCNVEVNVEYIPPPSQVEGKCSCTEVKVSGYSIELIYWTEPSITCPYTFILKNVTKPLRTSPQQFSGGDHMLAYIYNLYGGHQVICNVSIKVWHASSPVDSRVGGWWG